MSNCPKKTCTDWNAPVKAIFPLWTVPNHKCRTKSGCVKLRFVLFFRACECCDHGKKDMGIHSKQVQTFVISSECHHHQDNGVSTFSTPLWDVVFSIFNNLSSFEVCIIKVLSRDVFKEWQETSCFSSVWSRRVSTSDDHWSFWANVVPTSPPPCGPYGSPKFFVCMDHTLFMRSILVISRDGWQCFTRVSWGYLSCGPAELAGVRNSACVPAQCTEPAELPRGPA